MVQLMHKGSPQLVVVVDDMDALAPEGLDLHLAPPHCLVMPVFLHGAHHSLTDVNVRAATPGQLALDLSISPQFHEVYSLILGPGRSPEWYVALGIMPVWFP